MYLVDTVVLSELRKQRRDANVMAWFRTVGEIDLFLSVVTIGEIEQGIERQRKVNPRFAQELERWLEATLRTYGDRILPVTIPIVLRWGRLAAQIGNQNLDLVIAATALQHGLTVVTRDTSQFAVAGAATIDPFIRAPEHR